MFNKKLTTLLRTFSRPELRQLEKFLASGLQVCPANGGKLVSLLLKHYPDFDEKMPDKTWFYKQLFPGKPYNDSKLRLLVSDTYTAVKKFALLCHTDAAPENEVLLFANYLLMRDSPELLETEIGRAEKILDQRKSENELHFTHEWMLNHLKYKLMSNRFVQAARGTGEHPDLENIIHVLNNDYLTWRMSYQQWRIAFLKEPIPDELHDTYNRLTATMPALPEELTIMYKLVLLADNLKNESLLLELLHYFHSPKAESVSMQTQSMLFSITHNSCLQMVWGGKSNYQFEQHRLIKRIIGLTQLIFDGKIHTSTLCNFAQTCTIFGDVPFFESFYKKIEHKIPKKVRESTYHFCQAYITFGNKDYTAALHHLQKITHDSFRRRLFFKTLLMRIFYERREHEALLSLADSVSHFLAGTPILHIEERNYNNRFIHYIEKLVRLYIEPDQAEIEKLKKKLAEEPSANWRWLTAKIAELQEERTVSETTGSQNS